MDGRLEDQCRYSVDYHLEKERYILYQEIVTFRWNRFLVRRKLQDKRVK